MARLKSKSNKNKLVNVNCILCWYFFCIRRATKLGLSQKNVGVEIFSLISDMFLQKRVSGKVVWPSRYAN